VSMEFHGFCDFIHVLAFLVFLLDTGTTITIAVTKPANLPYKLRRIDE